MELIPLIKKKKKKGGWSTQRTQAPMHLCTLEKAEKPSIRTWECFHFISQISCSCTTFCFLQKVSLLNSINFAGCGLLLGAAEITWPSLLPFGWSLARIVSVLVTYLCQTVIFARSFLFPCFVMNWVLGVIVACVLCSLKFYFDFSCLSDKTSPQNLQFQEVFSVSASEQTGHALEIGRRQNPKWQKDIPYHVVPCL